jgi:hypothetical protein
MKFLCFPAAVDFCKRVFKSSPPKSKPESQPRPSDPTSTKMAPSTASTTKSSSEIKAGIAKLEKKLDSLLPQPPVENLTSNFVLQEIIEQIDLIKDE